MKNLQCYVRGGVLESLLEGNLLVLQKTEVRQKVQLVPYPRPEHGGMAPCFIVAIICFDYVS